MTRLIARHAFMALAITAFIAIWGFAGWLENY